MRLFDGIDACPPCRACGGSGEHRPGPGAIEFRCTGYCPRCRGTGREVPPNVVSDPNGIAWVLE